MGTHEYAIGRLEHQAARWADPGLEYANLQLMETKSGHSWERTEDGDIKFVHIERQCIGPICLLCGFSFCVYCLAQEGLCLSSYEPPRCTRSAAEPALFEEKGLDQAWSLQGASTNH